VPIRKTFVQIGHGKHTRPGPLANFVSAHDERGLDAYLFVHAVASASPFNCDYPSGTYVRALDLGSDAEPASARGAVSKVMCRLEDRQLITRSHSAEELEPSTPSHTSTTLHQRRSAAVVEITGPPAGSLDGSRAATIAALGARRLRGHRRCLPRTPSGPLARLPVSHRYRAVGGR